jgi:integrase
MKKTARTPRRKGKIFHWVGFVIRELKGKPQPYLVDVRRADFIRRKTFATLKDAQTYCEQLRDELADKGASAFDLTDQQRLDAKAALEVLGTRCALADAAKFWRKYHPDQGAIIFNECLTKYRAWMEAQRMRPATMQGLWRLDKVARSLGNLPMMAVTADDLTNWLDGRGFTPTNRNNYRRRLSALFSYAVDQRIIEANPVERVHVVKVEAQPVVFWNAGQVAMLMHTTERIYPNLVPIFAVMAFAGLRPTEAEALRWENINLTERIIRVEGATSKTRRRRVVPMPDNLIAWLMQYRAKTGRIAPMPQTLRRWRHRIAAAVVLGDVPERMARRKGMMGVAIRDAGNLAWSHMIAEAKRTQPSLWPPDVLRHSYASHWLPVHRDEGALSMAMGNSPNIIHRHYRGLVTESEAKPYWEIQPGGTAKIIPLHATA